MANNTLPYFDGDRAVARYLTAGAATMAILSDSIIARYAQRTVRDLMETWRVPKIRGMLSNVPMWANNVDFALVSPGIQAYMSSQTPVAPGDASPALGGTVNYCPATGHESVFNNTGSGVNANIFSNRLVEMGILAPAITWPTGTSTNSHWARDVFSRGKDLTGRVYFYRNANGCAAGTLYLQSGVSGAIVQTGATFGLAGAAGLVSQSVVWDAATMAGLLASVGGMRLAVRYSASTASVTGKNAICCCCVLDTGETDGLKILPFGVSGYKPSDFTNTAKYSAASWSFLTSEGVDVAFIQLTANGNEDDATFLTNTQALINLVRANVPNCKIILSAQDSAGQAGLRPAVYRALSRSNAGAVFLNMQRAMPTELGTQGRVLAWSAGGTYQPGDAVSSSGSYVNKTGVNTATAPAGDATNWAPLSNISDGPGTFYNQDRNLYLDEGTHLNILGRKLWAATTWGLLSEAGASGSGVIALGSGF